MADRKSGGEDRLGDLLVQKKVITPEQLNKAVQCQVLFGGRLGTNLLELGFVTEDDLRTILEQKYKTRSVTRDELKDVPDKVVRLVSAELAGEACLVPVRATKTAMDAAMLDPWKESAVARVTEATSLKVTPLVALELDVFWALEKYYGLRREARMINLDRWLDHQRKARGVPPVKKTSKVYRSEPLLPNPQDITSLEGAPQNLDDFWDRVGRSGHPRYLAPRVLRDLDTAESREEIASILLDFAALQFRRCLLFVVNEDMLFGWDGRGDGITSEMALAIMLPLSRRSIFRTVVETGAYFLGPVPDSQINKRFLAALGGAKPATALLLPILVAGKVVAILYSDMGREAGIKADLTPLQTTLAAVGKAFHRLIVRRKAENAK